MSTSYTTSTANTFTVVHARDMAAKVSTDLKRMQRLYGLPSDAAIAAYETEVVELLRRGYLGTAFYGFRRDGKWIEPTLRYTAHELAVCSVLFDVALAKPKKALACFVGVGVCERRGMFRELAAVL